MFRCAKAIAVENQTLELLASFGASLSRSDLVGRSVCVAGTRRKVIDKTLGWVLRPSERGNSILWLYGAAGAGKSAVAATVATHFDELQRLGAFIGFDRESAGRNQPSTVVLALAHQLALFDGRIAASIAQIINKDKRVLTARLSEQFNTLIIKPLASIPVLHGEGPIVIVMDALDECGQPNDRASLLEVLVRQTKNLPSNIRIIITSRTNDDIRKAFTASYPHIESQELSLVSDRDAPDITTYFKYRMQQIRRTHEDLKEDWPSQAALADLTARACGFFVWAVAASDFVDTHDPPKRLEDLLLRDNSSSTLR